MATYTVLEVSETEIRLLQLAKTRKTAPQVACAATIDVSDLPRGEDGIEARGARLKEKARAAKIAPGPVALLLPKQSCAMRTAALPSTDRNEIAEMARFEAEKFIPFNADRHIVSSMVLRWDSAASQVLIAAVDAPVIEAAVKTVQAAGFEPTIAEVTSVALVRAVSMLYPDLNGGPSPFLLVSIGPSQTEVTVLPEGVPITSRSQNLGIDKLLKDLHEAFGRPVAAAELAALNFADPDSFRPGGAAPADGTVGERTRGWVQRIARLVRQTLDFAAREHGVTAPQAVYAAGEGASLKGFAEALSAELRIPAQSIDPASKIALAPGVAADGGPLSGFAAAVGTALRLVDEDENQASAGQRINLLPPQLLEQQAASERLVLLMLSGTMVVITAILMFLTFDAKASHERESGDRYKKYNKQLKPIVDDVELKKQRLEIIDSINSSRASALTILDKISEYARAGSQPTGGRLTLTDFKCSIGEEVTIAGQALEIADINDFTNYLENMEQDGERIFSSIGIPQQNPQELSKGRPTIYSFSLTATLNKVEGRKDDETDAATETANAE